MWMTFFTYYTMTYILLQGSWNSHLELALAKATYKLVLSTQNSWCDICKCYCSQCKHKAVYLELYLFTLPTCSLKIRTWCFHVVIVYRLFQINVASRVIHTPPLASQVTLVLVFKLQSRESNPNFTAVNSNPPRLQKQLE